MAVPEESLFQIMTYGEYKSMGPIGLSSILERRNIIIRDMPTETMQFDEVGLSTLHPLYTKVEMQDGFSSILSIPFN